MTKPTHADLRPKVGLGCSKRKPVTIVNNTRVANCLRPAALLLLAVGMLGTIGDVSATLVVTFYANRAAFESALISKTTIDFESLDAGGFSSILGSSELIDGVTFSGSGGNPLIMVSSLNPVGGAFGSAVLFADGASPITADLTTTGASITAVGGAFGDMVPGSTTTMTVVGNSGVLDVRSLLYGDLRLGYSPSFFGWIVEGDSIVSISHDSDGYSEAIDNFVFGIAGDSLPPDGPPDGGGTDGAAPEPATLALTATALIGVVAARRRKFAVPTA